MLLRRSDLATGFKTTPSSPGTDITCPALDESDLTLTGDAESRTFTLQAPGRYFSIASEAQIYKTAGQALTSWRRSTSRAGEACARKELTKVIASSGAKLRSFARLSFPKVAPLTTAYRLVADIPSGAASVPAYMDVVVLQRTRAQVAFFVLSAGAPLVRSELLQFARTTAARMAKTMAGAGSR
jgi:hypothetical protein